MGIFKLQTKFKEPQITIAINVIVFFVIIAYFKNNTLCGFVPKIDDKK